LVSLIVLVVEIPIVTLILSLYLPVIFAILLSFFISVGGAILIFFLFTTYPKALVSNLADKINRGLPFSVSYMVASASSDAPPINLFKSLSKIDEYPELREQALNIVRDVEGMGMNLLAALRREAKRTPSKEFGDLLLGIESTLASGGDLTVYLNEKAKAYFSEQRAKIKTHADLLSMLTEIYITVMIVGPILFTLLSSVMGIMGGAGDIIGMQALISFILMPAISLVFAFYINISSP
jgi:flagellar protein FlaJ